MGSKEVFSNCWQDNITTEDLTFRFELKSMQDYHYSTLLNSEIPEEIILAILGDFQQEKPVDVVRKILRRLQKLSGNKRKLQRYIRQLAVLSNLRNLRYETSKQLKVMDISYDITKDFLYKEGIEKGKQAGKQEVILKMLASGKLTPEQIAEFADVPLKYVKQLQKVSKKK